tara:strand:- start:159 stop:563 length:405 start_codon:yes stop_codon:yes gene_type:complete
MYIFIAICLTWVLTNYLFCYFSGWSYLQSTFKAKKIKDVKPCHYFYLGNLSVNNIISYNVTNKGLHLQKGNELLNFFFLFTSSILIPWNEMEYIPHGEDSIFVRNYHLIIKKNPKLKLALGKDVEESFKSYYTK